MTANEANLTRRVEALANVVAELTAVNADLVKRVESLERGVTVRVRYPDGPLESPVVEVSNGAHDAAPPATGGAR